MGVGLVLLQWWDGYLDLTPPYLEKKEQKAMMMGAKIWTHS